jgi:ADP-ribose pyrophosphatase YjhB (NUDIX family)
MKQGIDYIGITCVFYCHDGKGNILLHKRSKKCRDERGRWDCGGGAVEFGETWEQTVRREVKEEYGCPIEKLSYVTANNVLRIHNGKPTHWIALLFSVLVDPKKTVLNDLEKMDQIGWFTFNNLPSPLHSMFLTHFKMVKSHL